MILNNKYRLIQIKASVFKFFLKGLLLSIPIGVLGVLGTTGQPLLRGMPWVALIFGFPWDIPGVFAILTPIKLKVPE